MLRFTSYPQGARLGPALAFWFFGTAVTAAAALPTQTVTADNLLELCARSHLTAWEIHALQKSGLLPDLLEFTMDQCPDVAAILSGGATATTTEAVPDGSGAGLPEAGEGN